MALENPYCTIQEVRDEIRNDDAAIDSQLERAVNNASRWIDNYVGRDFYLHDHTVTALVIDKWDEAIFENILFLPFRPIISVTELKVAGELWTSEEEYRLKDNTIVSLNGVWPLGVNEENAIQIKGKFGYDQVNSASVPTKLPKHINQAAILVAAAFSGHNQKEIVSLEGHKDMVSDKAIPKTVFDILGPKRKVIL